MAHPRVPPNQLPLTSPAASHADAAAPPQTWNQGTRNAFPYAFLDPTERLAETMVFGEFGGVNKSVEASTTFTVMEANQMPEIFQGVRGVPVGHSPHPASQSEKLEGCYLYGRHFNPTVLALSHEVAALEGAQAAYCTSSGMAAITSTLLQLCSHGDHIVASTTLYGGTFAFLNEMMPKKFNIHTTFVDISDHDAVRKALRPNTRVLYTETMSNPTLEVADIPALADICREHKGEGNAIQLVVDNTFAPLIVEPLKLGADVVVHSMTKFINGASDVIAGCICGSTAFITQLMDLHSGMLMLLGPTMDPRVAFEISMRLPHLGIRIKEHSRRALFFATEMDKLGLKVIYPGLHSHPHHKTIKRIMNPEFGYGGIIGLDCGSAKRAFELLDCLQNKYSFGFNAVSLGYFHTLMSCSGSSTSSELSEEEKKKAHIMPGLVRMSIGVSGSVEQRWRQLLGGLVDVGMLTAAQASV